MNQETERIFKVIESGPDEEKEGALLVLGDDIEFAHFKPEVIQAIVQRMINALPKETEWKIIKLLFRNISTAHMQQVDLSMISYDPLINFLDEAIPEFISHTLYLLTWTNDQKYLPVFTKYITHPDETVRFEAVDGITYLTKPRS